MRVEHLPMATAELVGVERRSRVPLVHGWNWGLIVAVMSCIALWAGILLSIATRI